MREDWINYSPAPPQNSMQVLKGMRWSYRSWAKGKPLKHFHGWSKEKNCRVILYLFYICVYRYMLYILYICYICVCVYISWDMSESLNMYLHTCVCLQKPGESFGKITTRQITSVSFGGRTANAGVDDSINLFTHFQTVWFVTLLL